MSLDLGDPFACKFPPDMAHWCKILQETHLRVLKGTKSSCVHQERETFSKCHEPLTLKYIHPYPTLISKNSFKKNHIFGMKAKNRPLYPTGNMAVPSIHGAQQA